MTTDLKTAKDFREYFSKGEEQLNSLIEEYLRAATKDDLEKVIKRSSYHSFTHPAWDTKSLLLTEINKSIGEPFESVLLFESADSGHWFYLSQLNQEDKLFLLDKIQEIL